MSNIKTATIFLIVNIFWILLFMLPQGTTMTRVKECSPLSIKFLKNAEYHILFGDWKVRLKEGLFKSGSSPEDYLNVKLFKVAFGDLNGDGIKDAGIILTVSGGGSGTFYELTALISQGESVLQKDSHLLGDRVIIDSLTIDSQAIVLDMLIHQENDPSCCPTKRVLRKYRLKNGKLMESEAHCPVNGELHIFCNLFNLDFPCMVTGADWSRLYYDVDGKNTVRLMERLQALDLRKEGEALKIEVESFCSYQCPYNWPNTDGRVGSFDQALRRRQR